MDSLTHIVLGACIGEVLLAPRLGKKALLWGALAQSLPDIDFIASPFLSPDADLLAHRGFTHSIIFAMIAGCLLSLLLKKIQRAHQLPFRYLAFFFILQILLHDLLDICNAYGTGLLEPFNHHRFSINLLYVADPLFSIWLVIASVVLIIKKSSLKNRRRWAYFGLIPAFLYLGFAAAGKTIVEQAVLKGFQNNGLHPDRYFITPTPFNTLLWYAVARQGSHYFISYRSVFDSKKQQVGFTKFEQNAQLMQGIQASVKENLSRYAEGFYTLDKKDSVTTFNVLRFGQVQGWIHPHAPFVFHYYLNADSSNALVVQRGRFKGWSGKTLTLMLSRMMGHTVTDTLIH